MKTSIILLGTGLLMILASCEKSKFASQPPTGEVSADATPAIQEGGVIGGHFDLDTAIETYAFKAGKTVKHVHQYDDKYGVTGVDYFHLLDEGFNDPITAVTPNQTFKIIIANAQLSPGARVSINGQTVLATEWQQRSQTGDLPIFSLSGAPGTQKLSALTITFDPSLPISGQLIPSDVDPVRKNFPGPGDSYRGGALTIQMIDAQTGQIDPKLGVARIGAAGMLWESTLFWHFNKED